MCYVNGTCTNNNHQKTDRKMSHYLFLLFKFLLKSLSYPRGYQRKNRSLKYLKYETMAEKHTSEELLKTTLVFDVEGVVLRSTSLFPYFMLVAFEGGGVLRGLVLFLFYPLVCLLSKDIGLKIMVFICFFGIKKDKFSIGRTVLPKFFLEDSWFEGFQEVMRCGRKVGLSELPMVMIEVFLKDYLSVDLVLGRDLKVVCGYFVGLTKEVPSTRSHLLINDVFGVRKGDSNLIGLGCSNKILDRHIFSHCKDIYIVSDADKRRWRALPRDKYPKPLIFHDGRITLMPTYLTTLAIIMWVPFGFLFTILRIIIGISFPYTMSIPILSYTGMRGRLYIISNHTTKFDKTRKDTSKNKGKKKGTLYVCNHKTLLDPIYISMAIMKPVTTVTYSLSRLSEFLAPLKTYHLSRNKEKDSKMMEMLLNQGDLVVCPEGTTCREPYVLRFSPLFSEKSNEIVPVALDSKVSMFYGTTASGFKFLDPLFFLLNPIGIYHVMILEKWTSENTCGKSSIDIANQVQRQIAETLGFQCTNLTRKDKYMVLAGNDGII
ncbi:probable glycerol-3-phosphate acyltransferase 3 [Lactuca sativa]|uniref:probable glycerol-3-phosphate acyltransferase 3 n=1 Tax=Lactuca sativa TaxID=4236 RepID=UPI000CD93028|nr:probable glycerol-3-phosphate acyltransferase 3 [Lactuca sativa]